MRRLVIDIEVIAEDWEGIDVVTQEVLTKSLGEDDGSDEYQKALEKIKEQIVFSPLTGEIVAIGVLDVEQEKGVVYFQDGGTNLEPFEEEGVAYKPTSEKEMLQGFWQGALNYQEFITFNGRGFDLPYIIARSGVHKVKVTKDLMSHRFLGQMRFGEVHIDLQEMVSYYGAVWKPGGLHMWCRAMGITSPKEAGVAGDDVGRLYREGEYENIARYNARDLWATRDLYHRWREFMRPN